MPNFLTRALQSVGMWAEDPAAPNPMDARWWNGGYAGGNVSGQAVTDQTALQMDVVQSVLGRLGGTISSLPMMVFERTGENSRRVAREHPLFKILHSRPNRRDTAQVFRDEQERHLASWRNCYSLIRPDPETGDPIGSTEIIHPTRVRKVWADPAGRVFYDVADLGGGGTTTWSEDDIWHIRKAPLTDDGLRGKPVWETSRETLGYAMAVRQFGALYFKNGGSGGGVLEHPANFKSTDDRDAFLSAWREGGIGLNRHKDRLLLFGAKYVAQGVKNDEAQFIETKRESNNDVCRLWNMPPHMVGILDKATFSNIEQQSIEYVVHTIAADIAAWEQSAGRDLLIGDDQDKYFVELNVAGLLRGDLKTRWGAYFQGRNGGWLSVNDVRRLENMDPIGPDGDIYLQPGNMNAAGAPSTDEEVSDPPAPGQPGDDPADRDDSQGN